MGIFLSIPLSFQENQHFAQSRYILCLNFAQLFRLAFVESVN